MTRVTESFRGRHILHAEKCISCGLCERICPNKAIKLVDDGRAKRGKAPQIDYAKCMYCGLCVDVCPTGALEFTNFYSLMAPSRQFFRVTPQKLSERPRMEEQPPEGRRSARGWGISRSLWMVAFGTGCCFIEAVPWMSNLYDMERLGMKAVGSPRHADVLVIGGYVTRKMMRRILRVYKQMPNPKFVVALGVCPMTGGTYWDSYNTVKNVEKYISVDLYISGCPPRPEAIGEAIYAAMKMIEVGYKGRGERAEFRDLGPDERFELAEEEDGYVLVPIGPAHPALCGLDILVKLRGEEVVDAKVNIGYLHRGFEKLAEYRTWWQNVALLQRICVTEGSHYELAYVRAVEKIAGLEPPLRARYLRVIQMELSRMQSHLMNLGMMAGAAGFDTVKAIALGLRERVLQAMELLTGARIYPIYNVPGGVRRDAGEKFLSKIGEILREVREGVRRLDRLLFDNAVFIRRAEGIAVISRDDIPRYNVLGPNARASGFGYDVRKAKPYEAYPDLDFKVVTRKEGDALARVLVRRDEILESARIVEQAVVELPSGPIKEERARDGRRITPFVPLPEGEVLSCVESARGEVCFHVISRGGLRPYRVKVAGPTPGLVLKLLPKLLVGTNLADVPLIYASIDNCPGDHDR